MTKFKRKMTIVLVFLFLILAFMARPFASELESASGELGREMGHSLYQELMGTTEEGR